MSLLSSAAGRVLSFTFLLVSTAMLAATGCLGRSDVEDSDTLDDGGLSGGKAGKGGGGSSGKAGSGGSGGTFGSGGGVTGGVGGSIGTAGVGGSFGAGGSFGSGGTGGGGCGSCAGCCDPTGSCRAGAEINACGIGGVDCTDCGALGFGCVNGGCAGPPPVCGPTTCSGCCDTTGRCHFGTQSDACGLGGGACAYCTSLNEACTSGKCQGAPPATCNATNCGGCCTSDNKCLAGSDDGACGINGASCSNCLASGLTCTQPGNYCAFFPSCGSVTCPTGCCDAQRVCQSGRTNTACGSSGQACSDCSASGQTCAPQGFCYSGAHCGPDNCGGCCSATGACEAGSTSLSCGQYGVLCDNCSTKSETCQNLVCANGSTCPAAYAGCNPAALTTPPTPSTGCTSADLDAMQAACAGQTPGAACAQFMQSLLGSNPACYDCMLQFLGGNALVKCVAPYLSSECNHELTCATDCSDTVCGLCDASLGPSCRDQAFQQSGACRAYVDGYFCLRAALGGPAQFCDLQQYNDIGMWLAAIGRAYCGG